MTESTLTGSGGMFPVWPGPDRDDELTPEEEYEFEEDDRKSDYED